MPQRLLRPGITHSERWNAVGWAEQSLFIRILTFVDDYGRWDGRESVIWSHCYGVWNHQNPHSPAAATRKKLPRSAVTLQQLAEMLQRLAAAGLILIFDDAPTGKRVLQVLQWQERIRDGAKERWPAPPKSVNGSQPSAAPSRDPQQSAAPRSIPQLPTPSPSSTPTPLPPTVPQGGQGSVDSEIIDLAEAKSLLHALFERKKRNWSHEEEHLLHTVTPFERSLWPLIEAWFRLPDDHAVFQVTKRKHELTTFLRDWNGEIDKMQRHASLFMASGGPAAKKDPPFWRELLRWHYENPTLAVPPYSAANETQRKVYAERFDDFRKEHGGEEDQAAA